MLLPAEFRSISFRVAMICTAFFVVSVLVILGTTYVIASGELENTLRAQITEDLQRLRQAYAAGGDAALREDFAELGEAASEDRFLLVLDALLINVVCRSA